MYFKSFIGYLWYLIKYKCCVNSCQPTENSSFAFWNFWNFFPKYFQSVIDYSSQGYTGPMVVLHYRNKPQFIYDYITEGHLNWIMFLLLLLPTVLPCTFLLPKVYFQEWICWVLRDIQLYKAMLTVSQSNSLNLVHESCHCLASLPKFGFVKLFLFLPICWVWNRILYFWLKFSRWLLRLRIFTWIYESFLFLPCHLFMSFAHFFLINCHFYWFI